MSKIIIVNERDEVVGAEDINVAIEKELIRRVARVFLVDSEGSIFLQRRAAGVRIFPDTWDQSAGGHVDEGESYEAAARRELKEELGLGGLPLSEIGHFYCDEHRAIFGKILRAWNKVYVARYDGGKMRFDTSEVGRGEWFSPQKIDEMISDNPDDFTESFVPLWKKYSFYWRRRASEMRKRSEAKFSHFRAEEPI